jgi:hypothetical protein
VKELYYPSASAARKAVFDDAKQSYHLDEKLKYRVGRAASTVPSLIVADCCAIHVGREVARLWGMVADVHDGISAIGVSENEKSEMIGSFHEKNLSADESANGDWNVTGKGNVHEDAAAVRNVALGEDWVMAGVDEKHHGTIRRLV